MLRFNPTYHISYPVSKLLNMAVLDFLLESLKRCAVVALAHSGLIEVTFVLKQTCACRLEDTVWYLPWPFPILFSYLFVCLFVLKTGLSLNLE